MSTHKQDIYTRISNDIVSSLEQGVKPWTHRWNAALAAGNVSCLLRSDEDAQRVRTLILLWASAMRRRYVAPIWITFKLTRQLHVCVRKGEKGSCVVYTNTLAPPFLGCGKSGVSSEAPDKLTQILLLHYLKTLKLRTFQREYQKLARLHASEGVEQVGCLIRLAEREMSERNRRI